MREKNLGHEMIKVLELLTAQVGTMSPKQCTMLIMALESAGMGSQALSALHNMKELGMHLNKVRAMMTGGLSSSSSERC